MRALRKSAPQCPRSSVILVCARSGVHVIRSEVVGTRVHVIHEVKVCAPVNPLQGTPSTGIYTVRYTPVRIKVSKNVRTSESSAGYAFYGDAPQLHSNHRAALRAAVPEQPVREHAEKGGQKSAFCGTDQEGRCVPRFQSSLRVRGHAEKRGRTLAWCGGDARKHHRLRGVVVDQPVHAIVCVCVCVWGGG